MITKILNICLLLKIDKSFSFTKILSNKPAKIKMVNDYKITQYILIFNKTSPNQMELKSKSFHV